MNTLLGSQILKNNKYIFIHYKFCLTTLPLILYINCFDLFCKKMSHNLTILFKMRSYNHLKVIKFKCMPFFRNRITQKAFKITEFIKLLRR